jgi:hypothetical protein
VLSLATWASYPSETDKAKWQMDLNIGLLKTDVKPETDVQAIAVVIRDKSFRCLQIHTR